MRRGAQCFFWIAALVSLNAVFTFLGSEVHLSTGLGVTAMLGRLAQPFGSSLVQVIVSFCLAGGFVALGYFAAEGRKWAFKLGMAAYAVDGALMVAANEYLGWVFHVLMLYAIYRGVAALDQPSSSKPSEVSSAAHAG